MNKQNIILLIFGISIAILFYLCYKNKKESFEGIAGSSFVSRVPKGTIVAYYPPDGNIKSIPAGWAACDGSKDGVPDLRGRFIRMYSNDLSGESDESSYVTKGIGPNVPQQDLNGYGRSDGQHISYIQKLQFKDVGGTDLQKMNEWEMPTHNHGYSVGQNSCNADCPHGSDINIAKDPNVNNQGGGMHHNNTPPYYVLVYIIKL